MISELDNYRQRLADLYQQVRSLIDGLTVEALNWYPMGEEAAEAAPSLAVWVAHICGAAHFWISEVIGGAPASRDRKAEFATQVTDPSVLFQLMQQTSVEINAVFARLEDADLDATRVVEGRNVPVRWGLLHVIDHTSLHLGHMQLTYQLWTGGKSFPSPAWFQRLPDGLNLDA